MKKILVKTERKNYPVYIGSNIFDQLPELVYEHKLPDRVFVIIDKKVESIYGSRIKKNIGSFSQKKYFFSITASERIKSFQSAEQVYAKLIKENFGRDTLIIAIGGGTIGDLSGFVSSTYMRGIPIVHIPTTLLSAVDSSVGGKTAINYRGIKNLIGTYYQPELVLADSQFLKSLPKKEMISGLGEVIKYSYLINRKLYDDLLLDFRMILKKDSATLNKKVYECLKIKSDIVSSDEREVSGIRKILNFGHTFAHAFESNSEYRLSHGLAVTAGILSALHLSLKKGFISSELFNYMIKLPLELRSAIKIKSFNEVEILASMLLDKKNRQGTVSLVLIKNFGEMLVDVNASKNEILWALKETNKILV